MSETAWAEELLDRFVIPLILGAEVHVGAPLGSAGALRLQAAAAHGLDGTQGGETLRSARQERLLALGWSAGAPSLCEDSSALLLLVALHDLLFLAHPDASRLKPEDLLGVGRGALLLCRRASLDAVSAEAALDLVFGRHSLLGRLWELGRDDVRRSSRRGVQVYKGMRPPRRWLPGSDTPDEVQRVELLPELVGVASGLGAEVLRALLGKSPLTGLLEPVRGQLVPGLTLDWVAQAGWLRQKAVARVVVRRCLELGLHTAGPALASVLQELLASACSAAAEASPRRDLCTWLCLISHLHIVAHVLTEAALPGADSSTALLDFYGLFAALSVQRPDLAMPPDALADPLLRARLEQHAQRCRDLAGSARTRALAALLPNP